MHYYIDGYNLMFRVLRAGDDLQVQREHIINDLKKKTRFLSLDVTIVFDAQYQPGDSSRSDKTPLEIHFTGKGETADELILDDLKKKKNPLQHTVVTSDKKLAWLARRKGAKTETVEEFIAWVNKRYKNKLLQQKKPQEKPVESKKTTPKEHKASKEPSKLSSPEECYDYYLEHFEKEVQQSIEIKKPSAEAKPKKRKKQALARPIVDEATDMERWLKAFQRNLDEEI